MLPLGWGKVGKSEWHFQERLDYLLAFMTGGGCGWGRQVFVLKGAYSIIPGNTLNFTVGLWEPRTGTASAADGNNEDSFPE